MTFLRRIPWVKLVLVISLAANLMVAGIVFGVLNSRGETGRALPMDRSRVQIALLTVMPREHRLAVKAELDRSRAERPDWRAQAQLDQTEFLELLRQPELEAAEVAGLLAAQRSNRSAGAVTFEQILSDEIARMSLPARQDYARRLERMRRWDKDDFHDHKDRDHKDRDHDDRDRYKKDGH